MPTILIIDDRQAERRLLYHALKAEHRVIEAADAAEAQGWLACTAVDVVLLDMHLPPTPESPREGIRIHGMLQADYPDLPVVIATTP